MNFSKEDFFLKGNHVKSFSELIKKYEQPRDLNKKLEVIGEQQFKKIFSELLSSNQLFNEYYNKVAYILNLAIDYDDFLFNYGELNLAQYQKKINKELSPKIDKYLEPIFFAYNDNLNKKNKVIKFLSKLYGIAELETFHLLKSKIVDFSKNCLEKEKRPEGNYYTSLHLDAVLLGKEYVESGKIAPERFVYKNFKNEYFISQKKDYIIIQELRNKIVDKEKELIENNLLIKKEFTREENKLSTTFIDYKSEHPLIKQLHKLEDELIELTSEMLAYFKEDISSEYFTKSFKNNSKLNDCFDHQFFLYKSVRNDFERQTGFLLNETELSEQYNFFEYTKEFTNKEISQVFDFCKKYKKNGFRTFLSIEKGGREMGDKILALGENLPEDIARRIFEKYGEIVDNVNKITEFAINNFTKEIKTTPELIGKIEETLYLKGKQLLLNTYEDILNKKEINSEEIIKHLNRINADTITTFAIFKQAVRNGEKLPIENIEGAIFSKKEASDIENNQQNEMLELYESNWKNHPDRNFVESLKEYFKTAFIPEDNKQKNFFYTFEKDNNIRAFVRFEEKDKKHLYASALNIDEASKNFGLGEAMMDEALAREAQKNILYASCKKDNPSNMRYFEKGFISRGFKKTNETEEFDLVWDENKNKVILAKQKSKEELIKMYLANNYEGNDIEMKSSENLEELNSFIPKNKAMVRCFFDNAKWYAVYEKVDEDYGMNFGEIK